MDVLLAGREIRLFRCLQEGVQAGLTLSAVLETVAAESDAATAEALRGVASRVAGGLALSEAMRRYPDAFQRWQREMVAIGESTGRVDAALAAVAEILEERRAYWLQVLPKVAYPLFLITVGPLILSAPLLFTQGGAGYMRSAFVPLLKFYGTLVAAYFVWKNWVRKLELWRKLDAFKGCRKALFCLHYAGLLRAGLGVDRSIELAGLAAGIDERLVAAAAAPGADGLVDRLKRLEIFSGREIGELRVGEHTGELPLALGRIMNDAKESWTRFSWRS